MIPLKALQNSGQRQDGDTLLEGAGYGLWVVWDGKVNPVLEQTLLDYGGLRVNGAHDQALWFFFTLDVFLAAAKLEVWAKYNTMAVTIQIFEAEIKCSKDGQNFLELPPGLWEQSIDRPFGFELYLRMTELPQDVALSGITLAQISKPQAFCAGAWRKLQADQRLPYKCTLAWYVVLRPVGSSLDKNFQVGWRDFFARLEDVLQRNKLRFNINDNFLMLPLDSLRQLRQWCRDYLNLVARGKKADNKDLVHWPCVMAIIERKKLHFNNELPHNMGLDWNQLMPDMPHLSMRDAMLLGEDFQIQEVRFARNEHTPSAWCNIGLAGEESARGRELPNLVPGALVFGPHEYCFYCGQRSHLSHDCPTRDLERNAQGIWDTVGAHNLDTLKKASLEINRRLQNNPEGTDELLNDDDEKGGLIRGILSINATVQLRNIAQFWKLRGRDIPKVMDSSESEDSNPIWGVLRAFRSRDPSAMDKELQNMQVRFPRDYRIFCLSGFAAMERRDLAKAEEYWRQAHVMCFPGATQSWHMFLLARLAEFQGHYADAISRYGKALESAPGWTEAEYRKMVCHVKSGFVGRALPLINSLILKNPHYFNWILLDPELDRGQTTIMGTLAMYWNATETQIQEERGQLHQIRNELHNWFTEESDFLREMSQRIEKVLSLSSIKNFVPYQMAINSRSKIEYDLQAKIMHEIKTYKEVFGKYLDRLAKIRDEAAWFPFPKMLREFNRNYNNSAANLDWVMHNNMHAPEIFKKAQIMIQQEEERIASMERRLRLLRIVRDGTLFTLVVARKFFWIELLGLALVLIIFPLLIYYGRQAGATWIYDVLVKEQWSIQKICIIIISVLSLVGAVFWSILRFENIRAKLFRQAKELAEKQGRAQAKKMERRRQELQAHRQAQARKQRVALK
ncbi:MAG: tetratricopeptide repeat protein [Desulfovibrionaceae bacterium]|nr:tetratricopeptide repeat protein [Desulfovibrionaceae bacterium]